MINACRKLRCEVAINGFCSVPDLARPEGITYDWTAKNIYWTDTGKKVIGVARSDGTYQKVLISSDVAKPRGIIVHPMMG